MRAHVIENGVVTNTIEIERLDLIPGLNLIDAGQGGTIGDSWDGQAFTPPVPPVPPAPTIAEYQAAAQQYLDTKARERNYDGILSLCSYAASASPQFGPEGQAGVQWRDDVWAACYTLLAQVQAGAAQAPTIAGLVAALPALEWPA